MPVYLWDGSPQTIVRAATLRQKLQIKFDTSFSHGILTPGRPVPVQTQASDRIATRVPIFKSLHGMTWPEKKSTANSGLEPRSVALLSDALLLGQRGGTNTGTTTCKLPMTALHVTSVLSATLFCLDPTFHQLIWVTGYIWVSKPDNKSMNYSGRWHAWCSTDTTSWRRKKV